MYRFATIEKDERQWMKGKHVLLTERALSIITSISSVQGSKCDFQNTFKKMEEW